MSIPIITFFYLKLHRRYNSSYNCCFSIVVQTACSVVYHIFFPLLLKLISDVIIFSSAAGHHVAVLSENFSGWPSCGSTFRRLLPVWFWAFKESEYCFQAVLYLSCVGLCIHPCINVHGFI